MSSESVKVMVRCRPLNNKEKQAFSAKGCVSVDSQNCSLSLRRANDPESSAKVYTYDRVFGQNHTQKAIYEESAFSLVESIFEGYNGTIFAYGQTGCGKTFTMMGEPRSNDDEQEGIIPRTFSHIMNVISSEPTKEFVVRCSYLEIYNENIHDLLAADPRAKYELKESPESGVFVKDLKKVVVKSVTDMKNLMLTGNRNRSTGETAMNKDSSRSHSIFTVYVEISERGEDRVRAGKLNLVDLAGSERQVKTQATGERLKEANQINLSLSALGNVISALVDGKHTHIPYRDSKLTRLLQDSLGGNTKTIMIAAISPSESNYDETIGTLRYASRAKNIKNKPKINEDPKDTMLREYAEEIARLKAQLQNNDGSSSDGEELEKWRVAHQELSRDKERIEQELKERQEEAVKERMQNIEMLRLFEELEEQKLIGGSDSGLDAASPVDLQRKEEYMEMRMRLSQQRREQEAFINQSESKKRQDPRATQANRSYASLQDEVVGQRKILEELRRKRNQVADEVKDIERECRDEKIDLLEQVCENEKENKLYSVIIQSLFDAQNFTKIKDQSVVDDYNDTYQIPPFVFKGKDIKFIKVQPYSVALRNVDAERDLRELIFCNSDGEEESFDDIERERNNNNAGGGEGQRRQMPLGMNTQYMNMMQQQYQQGQNKGQSFGNNNNGPSESAMIDQYAAAQKSSKKTAYSSERESRGGVRNHTKKSNSIYEKSGNLGSNMQNRYENTGISTAYSFQGVDDTILQSRSLRKTAKKINGAIQLNPLNISNEEEPIERRTQTTITSVSPFGKQEMMPQSNLNNLRASTKIKGAQMQMMPLGNVVMNKKISMN